MITIHPADRIAAAKRAFLDADPLDVPAYDAAKRELEEARAELRRIAAPAVSRMAAELIAKTRK